LESRRRLIRGRPLLADIVAKVFFWGDERKILEPLMHFARGDLSSALNCVFDLLHMQTAQLHAISPH
jgi:hypothetical protein